MTVRAQNSCMFARLPDATELAEALGLTRMRCSISDLLPHGFTYKPMLFDCGQITQEEGFRIYKQIKSAKYIHRDLLLTYRTAEELLNGVLSERIKLCQGWILPRYDRFQQPWQTIILAAHSKPAALRLTDGTTLDILLGLSDAAIVEYLHGLTQIHLQGNTLSVDGLEPLPFSKAERFVLQAPCPVSAAVQIGEESESVFRVALLRERGLCLVPGSTMIRGDTLGASTTTWDPFLLPW